jgi:fructosamine-3-kinase
MDSHFKTYIENCLNKHFKTNSIFYWQAVSGGSINNTFKVFNENHTFFVKTNTKTVFENGFNEEVLGLQFLAKHKALVPNIVLKGSFNNYIYLVLEWVESVAETTKFWINFAEQLANLHQQKSKKFGLDYANYMGQLLQTNTFSTNFSDFFIENRLKPQVKLAYNSAKFSKKNVDQIEKLYKKLPEIFPTENPCAVHGDLWSGNFMCSKNQNAVLIDPAVYYGHREIDLAMTTLFGGFSTVFYNHYNEIYPLEKGFNNRKDFYNLYPLLIHLNLFGSSYLRSIENIITEF